MGIHSHVRGRFESEEAKWQQAALALVQRAESQSSRSGEVFDPKTVGLRAEDYPDGKINPALAAAIDKELQGTRAAASSAAEVVEVDPRLATFKADYDTSQNPKLKSCAWAEIQNRLLADEGEQLAAALGLNEGGILFGVDAQGNPLICDRGDQPVMRGMNYQETHAMVVYKHDSYDIKGQILKDSSGQAIPTGYEMFPYIEPYEKSDETTQYEEHTGKPFIEPPLGQNLQSSWVESGENPILPEDPLSSWPRELRFNPLSNHSYLHHVNSMDRNYSRGVRRLLRVIKKA